MTAATKTTNGTNTIAMTESTATTPTAPKRQKQIQIKSTQKFVKNFIFIISKTIQKEYDEKRSEGTTEGWMEIWDKWKENGLADVGNKSELTALIMDLPKVDKTKTVPKPMNVIVDAMREKIPMMDKCWTFELQSDNSETYMMAERNIGTMDTTPIVMEENSEKSMKDDNNKNATWIEIAKGSRSNVTPISNAKVNLPKVMETPTHQQFQSLSDRNEIKTTPISEGSDETGISYDEESKSDKLTSIQHNMISHNEIQTIENAIKNSTIDISHIQTLSKWYLNTYMENEKKFARHTMVLSKVGTHLKQMLNQQADEIMSNMEQEWKQNNNNNKILKDTTAEAKRQIKTTVDQGIDAISRKCNNTINDVKTTLEATEKQVQKLDTYKNVGMQTHSTLDQLLHTIKKAIELEYAAFEARLDKHVDMREKKINSMMEKHERTVETDLAYIKEFSTKKEELEEQRNAVQQEHLQVKQEAEQLRTERLEFKEYCNNMMMDIKSRMDDLDNMIADQEMSEYLKNDKGQTNAPTLRSSPSIPIVATSRGPSTTPTAVRLDETVTKSHQQRPPSRASHQSTPPQPTYTKPPPYPAMTIVRYKNDLYNVLGYIMYDTPPKFDSGHWHYEIITIPRGLHIYRCSDEFMTVEEEVVDPFISHYAEPEFVQATSVIGDIAQTPPQERFKSQAHRMDNNSTPTRPWNRQQSSSTYNGSNKSLAHNQFEYPLGTSVQSVWSQSLIKYGAKWDIMLRGSSDLRPFYDRLCSLLSEHSVYLIPYDDIRADKGLEAITPFNCRNFENARKAMSTALFLYFDSVKSTIFADYSEPRHFLEAYRVNSDGLGFLKEMMEERHPHLTHYTNTATTPKPTFQEYESIYTFINGYIDWLDDEKLRFNRQYTDKEKIDHVLESLDSRFDDAITKIRTQLTKLYTNPMLPEPFPDHLKLTTQLGRYIVKLIPIDQRNDLTNEVSWKAKVNKVSTRSSKRENVDKTMERKSNNRPPKFFNPKKNKNKVDKEMGDLKWEVMPGEECPGCGKSNHNVYKTGCPSLAVFANCQDFYRKHKDEDIMPKVKDAYKQYQKELRKKLRAKRNDTRGHLRVICDVTAGDSDVQYLKDLYFDTYKQNNPEEQFATKNFFNNLEDESSSSDESESQ